MKTKFFLAILVASMFFLGCSDDDHSGNPVDVTRTAKDFFSKSVKKLTQTFQINVAELPKTLTLRGGTVITIEDGTFAIGGVPITGTFTLEVIECLKPSDIVYTGTNTNYIYGDILRSYGFIFINAKQGESNVDKNLLKNMDIKIPRQDDTPDWVLLWEGVDTAGDDNDQFAWDYPSDDVVVDNTGFGEIMAEGRYFPFKLGKLGWFNCDIYWTYGTKTTMYVNITGNPVDLTSFQGETGSTSVFFHGYGDLVVASLYTLHGTNGVKSYDDSMPIGKKGTLLAISVKDGKFYFAKQDNVEITEDLEITLNMEQTTENAIQAAINALDSTSGN
ncbi:MAG: hypothetical protein LBH30_02010 [Prevotellaceae bacterium]|jgi:hypothetical protein|nr:hypothetical protein [Prevotellaceae bacterium]